MDSTEETNIWEEEDAEYVCLIVDDSTSSQDARPRLHPTKKMLRTSARPGNHIQVVARPPDSAECERARSLPNRTFATS
jgi:hypothetical protein